MRDLVIRCPYSELHPPAIPVIRTARDQLRHRGLRWLVRHECLDRVAAADMRAWQHGGGWSVDASVRVAAWDRQGLERLVRYCARPPLTSGRLGRLNADTLVYRLRRPLLDGRTEILLTPPRKHRHRYCGVLAPAVLPARGPPQGAFEFDQTAVSGEWAEVDQTVGLAGTRSEVNPWN